MFFSLLSLIISLIKMMNTQNMWFMIYLCPQITCQLPYSLQEINPLIVLPSEKVEQKKIQKQKQEFTIKKLSSQPSQSREQFKILPKGIQCENEDSSFSLPVKQSYKTTQQKLGRNSISNILRLFTKLLKHPNFKQKYMKIKEKYGIEITWKEFNSWISGTGLNMNKYIRMKKILNGIRTKPKFGRILSILYSIFESEFARTAALTSTKTQSKNILPTLSQIRNIKEQINEAIVEGFAQKII